MLSKERTMTDDPAKLWQGDPGKVLLPLLLQSLLTGKQIDATEILSVLLTGKPSAVPVSTPIAMPAPQPAPPQPTDVNTLLLPLLYQALTGRPWPDATPEPEKPRVTPPLETPAMSKPSVQLSVAGLALSTILQALGIVGTPFNMGQDPTQIGTLATLVPMITGTIGATGGFGALQNIGRRLFGGFASAASKRQ